MYKELFLNKKNLIDLILLTILNIFLFVFFMTIFAINEIAYNTMEFTLYVSIFALSYTMYSKYSRRSLTKRITYSEKNKLKLFIVIKILIYSFYVAIISLIFSIIADTFFIRANYNSVGFMWEGMHWEIGMNYFYWFYFATLEILLMITFWYFINHFIKNKSLIICIFIFVGVYMALKGNLTSWILGYSQQEGIHINIENHAKFFTNTIIFPWLMVGAKGKHVFVEGTTYFLTNQILFETSSSYSSFYYAINYIPYIMIGLYFTSGSLSSFLKSKNY